VWFDTPVLREPAVAEFTNPTREPMQIKLEHLWAWMIRQSESLRIHFTDSKTTKLHRLDRDIAWMRAWASCLDQRLLAKADFYRFLQNMTNDVAQTF
jgi:hypothetical protein